SSTCASSCSGRGSRCIEMNPPAETALYTARAPAAIDWAAVAARGRLWRRVRAAAAYAFLVAVSIPIILPYFWLVTVAFSAKRGIAETTVLWRSLAILVPAVLLLWIAGVLSR